jgi:Tfp pilus assembly protein PilN
MQINLVPKTRELQDKRKRINGILYLVGLSVIASVGIITFILYTINFAKKNEVKNLESDIDSTRNKILQYAELEIQNNYVVWGLDNVKTVLDTRKDWTVLYGYLEDLMPKESYLTEIFLEPGNIVRFKTEAKSAGKASEFIDSLRSFTYESSSVEGLKLPLFVGVNVSNYSKSIEEDEVKYYFEIEAIFTEDIWTQKN